jgi:uracil-DNA glycosylase
MKQTIDIEDIKSKIYEKLKPSGWAFKLRGFIFSSDFDNIIKQLIKEVQQGKRFTPTLKDMFRAFEECPYEDLKLVIVGQDPYPQLGVADGIAFSCGKTQEMQPSLKYMLNEITATVYNGHNEISNDYDLKRWSNQGILLINSALTTTIGKTACHYDMWQPFLAYLFDILTWSNNGLVYLYLGKQAQKWKDAVNDSNYKFIASHPASAAYNKQSVWDSKGVFKEITDLIEKNYKYKIEW